MLDYFSRCTIINLRGWVSEKFIRYADLCLLRQSTLAAAALFAVFSIL